MHCWKTINVQSDYGTTRLFLLSSILFILVFSFAYVTLSFNYANFHSDQYFVWAALITFFLYPVHKLLHFLALFDYRRTLAFRFKIQHHFILVMHMRLQQSIPKWRYLIALLTPFIFITILLITLGVYAPQYAHYISFLLAFHTSICLIDLLYVKHLRHAPKHAVIEETPRGYEILIPMI